MESIFIKKAVKDFTASTSCTRNSNAIFYSPKGSTSARLQAEMEKLAESAKEEDKIC
jgi:hypothetical protein